MEEAPHEAQDLCFARHKYWLDAVSTRRPLPNILLNFRRRGQSCADILDGMHDDLPSDAFYFADGIEEVHGRAAGAA